MHLKLINILCKKLILEDFICAVNEMHLARFVGEAGFFLFDSYL